jgi:hypothetical protein
VGKERHKSCLMLTSREQLNEVALMQAGTPSVRSLLLSDLNDAAAWQIFKSKGLLDESSWHQLLQIYRGNPLVLNIISSYIKIISLEKRLISLNWKPSFWGIFI